MAVIQYSALINQMRGKLGGSVFNKSKNSYTLQRKQQQPVGTRGNQSTVRNRFGNFQRSWKELTNAQRVNWQTTAGNNPARDRFGNLTVLSGYNQFLKASMLATYGSQTPPSAPYTAAAPSAGTVDISPYDWSFSQNANGRVLVSGQVEIIAGSATADFCYIIDVSVPVSAGVMTYHGRWVYVAGDTLPTYDDFTVSRSLGVRYPMWVVGQSVYTRSRVVHTASGAVVWESIMPVNII